MALAQPGWPDPLPAGLAWMATYLERRAFCRAEVAGLWNKAVGSGRDALLPGLSPDGVLRAAYDAGRIAATALLASRHIRLRAKVSHHEYTFAAAAQLGVRGLEQISSDATEVRLARNNSEYGAETAPNEDRALALAWMRRTLPLIRAALVDGDAELGPHLGAAPKQLGTSQ